MEHISLNEQTSIIRDDFRDDVLSQQKEEVHLQFRLTKRVAFRAYIDIRRDFEKYGEVIVLSDFQNTKNS